jgi:hypothetical protein
MTEPDAAAPAGSARVRVAVWPRVVKLENLTLDRKPLPVATLAGEIQVEPGKHEFDAIGRYPNGHAERFGATFEAQSGATAVVEIRQTGGFLTIETPLGVCMREAKTQEEVGECLDDCGHPGATWNCHRGCAHCEVAPSDGALESAVLILAVALVFAGRRAWPCA